MAAIFVSLPVPAGPGVGQAANTSGFGAAKTIVVDGPNGAEGELIIEGSDDGSVFAPLTKFFTVDNPPEEKIVAVVAFMRVRRLSGGGAAFVAMGAQQATTNQFSPLDTDAIGTGGMGPEKTILVSGTFEGPVIIESSNDGSRFGAVAQLDAGGPGVAHVSGDYLSMRVRTPLPAGAIVQLGAGFLFEGGGGGGTSENLSEPVSNQSGTDVFAGQLIRIVGNDIIALTNDNQDRGTGVIGVALTDMANGASGRAITHGRIHVRMQSDIASVNPGEPLWMSIDEEGRATNVQPDFNQVPIGTVKDSSGYVQGETVIADLTVERTIAALGYQNKIAIGSDAGASQETIAIGNQASSGFGNLGAIAIGNEAVSSGLDSVALGTQANSTGDEASIAVGRSAAATGTDTIAIGREAAAPAGESIAIGFQALTELTQGNRAIAIGARAFAANSGGGAVGGNVALGSDAEASGVNSVAIGAETEASAFRSVAIGRAAAATANLGTAVGEQATASHNLTTAIGSSANASEQNATAVGSGATATETNTVAVGQSADATGTSAIAIGSGALANAANAVGIGSGVFALGTNSVALGTGASASLTSSIAIGTGATASLPNQCTIGAAGFSIDEFRVASNLGNIIRAIKSPASGDTGLDIRFFNGVSFFLKTVRAGAGGSGPGGVGRALYIDT